MRYGSIQGVGDRISRLVLGSMVFSTDHDKIDITFWLLDRFLGAGHDSRYRGHLQSGYERTCLREVACPIRNARRDVVVGKGADHDVTRPNAV